MEAGSVVATCSGPHLSVISALPTPFLVPTAQLGGGPVMNMHVSHTCDQQLPPQGMAAYQLLETDDSWQLLSVAHRAPCPDSCTSHPAVTPPQPPPSPGHQKGAQPTDPKVLLLRGQSAPKVLYINMFL
jgi:hypothetical protein